MEFNRVKLGIVLLRAHMMWYDSLVHNIVFLVSHSKDPLDVARISFQFPVQIAVKSNGYSEISIIQVESIFRGTFSLLFEC